MFSLTIAVGNTAWALMYKTEGSAQDALAVLEGALPASISSGFAQLPYAKISDDFGQVVSLNASSMHGFILEDLTVSKGAHIERALQQARTHAEAQTAWQNDPVARAAARGPSVLAPGMHIPNGRFSQ
jgi:hypothetical protein